MVDRENERPRARNRTPRDFLGEALIKRGVITEEQLREALANQGFRKNERGLLGKILIDMGYCTEADIAGILATQAGVELISLEEMSPDPAAMSTVTPEDARRYNALPIAFREDRLVVAMKHPNDILALDDLRILTGFDIEPVVVVDNELEASIRRYSHETVGVEQAEEEELDTSGDIDPMEEASERPAVQLANMILSQAVSSKASDVHIEMHEAYLRIRFRIDGVLHDIMNPPRRMHASLVSRIKVMSGMDIAERRVPQDGRMTLRIEGSIIDVRVASLPATFGERLTLRLLDRSERLITLEELGVVPSVLKKYRESVDLPYGFILVTGPTGSGKSTTLYASLATVDRAEKNVITVEDPVERRMEEISQIQINPRAGLTFASGLRSILRCDPDIIMVGEIRDAETARIAIESALTGHLVFATLHTNDASGAVSRLTEMNVEPYLTASSLACVLAQRLARVLCPHCKEEHYLDRAHAEKIPGFPLEADEEKIRIYRPKPGGCLRCASTGYSGRIGIYELLPITEEIQRMTLDRRSAGEIRRKAIEEGMITLREDGLAKVREGMTSLEEVMRVVL